MLVQAVYTFRISDPIIVFTVIITRFKLVKPAVLPGLIHANCIPMLRSRVIDDSVGLVRAYLSYPAVVHDQCSMISSDHCHLSLMKPWKYLIAYIHAYISRLVVQ